ncbi:MAG: hypothetical protein HGA54_06645, partial [Actinobacteria bacterium]|nr:hypothetical protein [Actinomycetota bacterium]
EEEVAAFFDELTDFKIKLIGKLAQYYKPDTITYHDDWGMQKALFFAPEIWRTLIKPRTKRIVDAAHEHGILFIMHSCGKLDEIIPEIAEIGVDTLQCMDINDIGKALETTKGSMSIQASVHTQDFKALDSSNLLTPEFVHGTVHKEFMEWGATGRYMPFIFNPSVWYEEIIMEEYESCRQALKGSYTS